MTDQPSLFDDQPLPGEYPLPEGVRPTNCRSCGAAVVWTTTANDKQMILDIREGNVREINGLRYAMNHWAKCPHAKDWSRKNSGTGWAV